MNDARNHQEQQPASGTGDDGKPDGRQQSLSFWQVIGSTVAAAFGVQSSRNRQRDFTHGKPVHFVMAGLVFTVLFVLALVLVVNAVL